MDTEEAASCAVDVLLAAVRAAFVSVGPPAPSLTASLSRRKLFPTRSGEKDEQWVERSGQEPVALPGSRGQS